MISTFWLLNYIGEKAVSEHNTSWATRCQQRLPISPETLKIDTIDVTHLPCTDGCGLKATIGDGNGPKFRAARIPMARRWDQNPDIRILCLVCILLYVDVCWLL